MRVLLQDWLVYSPFGPKYDWIPFAGQFGGHRPFDGHAVVVALTVVLPGLVWLALALDRLRTRRPTLPVALVIASVLLFVVVVPAAVEVDYASAGRSIIPLVLGVVLWLPDLRATPRFRPRPVRGAIWLLTVIWFGVVLALTSL
ncbi:MAG TPA: hypothetical protein VH063_01790 [Gaiellaceae bacterium]|nr:hypothetical protein [Gaiellaceae bacterium]